MKKYILAALLAAFFLIGPSVGSANAQGYFYRGGPTFVDRLFGNGGGYGYGGYGGYNPYNNGCNNFYRNGYGGNLFGFNNGYNNYGGYNPWRHHHHHRCW